MKRSIILPLLCLLVVLASPGVAGQGGHVHADHAAPTPRAEEVEVVVDGGVTYQSWDGWGLSISGQPWEWTVLHHLNRLPAEDQKRLQDSLFGVGGYNLALIYPPVWIDEQAHLREGLEPQNDDGDPDHYNWGGFRQLYTPGDPNPFARPGDADYTAATYRAIAELRSYGTTLIFNAEAFPAWMLSSGQQLPRAMEPEFVEHVTAFPLLVRQQLGYDFPYMIIANEPDLNLDTSPDQVARLLRLTRDRLRREGLGTQLIAPKTSTLAAGVQYADAFARHESSLLDIPVLATHTYPTRAYDPEGVQAMRRLASAAGRRLWLTEYSDAPDMDINRDDPADTLERSLAWAERVQRDLTVMQVNAWFAIIPVLEPGHYPADALAIMLPDHDDPTRNRWELTRRYYALAHYTRFIRPGAVRVEARAATLDLAVVAFRDPDSGVATLVATNRSNTDQWARVRLENVGVGSAVVYTTSAAENLACARGDNLQETGMLLLPAQSITTLVTGPPSATPSCSG